MSMVLPRKCIECGQEMRPTDYLSRLREELAAARADAERYRWLRNKANFARRSDPMVCLYPLGEQSLIDGTELDEAIDSAIDFAMKEGK